MSTSGTYLGWKVDFTVPPGEPALVAPDSVAWRVLKNPISVAIGGIAAVLLEFADPRIRTGVWEHSVFPSDPIGRARRTGTAAAIGYFGPASAARQVIGRVTAMHARVSGTTPGGRPYRALDPELLDWVAATAAYGFLVAYDRFAAPVSEVEAARYFGDAVEVGRLYGVENRLSSLDDFDAMLTKLEPGFEPHPINREFLEIIRSGKAAHRATRGLQRLIAHAAVDILPPRVRTRLELGPEYDLGPVGRRVLRSLAGLAETIPNTRSPAAQACERLGLPRTFLWKSEREQRRLLQTLRASPAPVESAGAERCA